MSLLPHMFFAAVHVYHTCFLQLHMSSSWDSSSYDLSSHTFLSKNKNCLKKGLADLSSFIFCIEQLIFSKKCWPIACITIRAVEHLPDQPVLSSPNTQGCTQSVLSAANLLGKTKICSRFTWKKRKCTKIFLIHYWEWLIKISRDSTSCSVDEQ